MEHLTKMKIWVKLDKSVTGFDKLTVMRQRDIRIVSNGTGASKEEE